MDIQLISLNADSVVSRLILKVAAESDWTVHTVAPAAADFSDLPSCNFLLVLVDSSDDRCFEQFVRFYSESRPTVSRIIKYIVFDTVYNQQKALAVAGLFDVQYAQIPDSAELLYQYIYRASGCGDNFVDIARSHGTGAYSEIIDRYALISVTDPRGVIVTVNQRFIDVSGYQRDELIGSKHNILKSRKHPPEFYSDLWHTISSGKSWRGNVCNRKKNGEYYWVDSFIFPIKDASNRIRLYMSFRYDITQEMELKHDLILRDERVRISHEYANVGTWDWNIKTGSLYWSQEIHKLFGYEEPILETTYANFIQSIHPDDRELVISRVNESVNYGTPYSVEHRVVQPNGEVRWLAERGHVMRDETGKPVRMLGVVSDIHELIQAKKDALDAEQLKTTFISTLSHEIRNPLNAAAGFSRIIAESGEGGKIKEYADKIESIIDHVSGILEDINLNNKLETGNIVHTLKPINLEKIIDDSIEIAQSRPTSVTVEKQDVGGSVVADAQHLRQIIINLLSNAIKYNRPSGSVFIRTRPSDNQKIRIEVEDTGFGIAQPNLPKLFTPYERLKWAKSEIDGLGLGLPICKGLIENMGGTIGVTSTKDQGSTFWVELPETFVSYNEESEVTADYIGQLSEYLPLSALVLDDNEFNLEFMRIELETLGLTVDTAADGQQGLAKIDEKHYDFILTDLNMPVLDGRELIKRIRSAPSQTIKPASIIVVSADSLDRSDCLALGANACLTKPVKKEALEAVLIKVLTHPETESDCCSRPVIDEQVLQHHLGNDPEKVSRLLNIFLDSLNRDIDDIRGYEKGDDPQPLAKTAHKLLSPSKSVGAIKLSHILEKIESAANDQDAENLIALIDPLSQVYKATLDSVSHIIHANQSDGCSENADHTPNNGAATSTGESFSVLAIDDDEFSIKQLQQVLSELPFLHLQCETDPESGLKLLDSNDFDLLILDINMPRIDGIQFIRHLADRRHKPAVILYTSEKQIIHSASDLIANYGIRYIGSLDKPCSRLSISRLLRSFRKDLTNRPQQRSDISDATIGTCINEERVLLVFQPQISTKTNRAISVEALARLVDTDGNIIAPTDFLPRLDKLGLENSFSYIVASKAIMQLAQWHALGMKLRMAINFSMNALEDIRLPETLITICNRYRIDPKNIIVEVTETALSARPHLASEVLVRLKLSGFTLSVDDFGTGYSSLEKLQKLPFSEIKLDRSYVSNATTDDISRALLNSSIGLANQLNLITVAEGVETRDDYELAVKSGVDLIQGFYFSKPLLPDTLHSWFKEFHHGR